MELTKEKINSLPRDKKIELLLKYGLINDYTLGQDNLTIITIIISTFCFLYGGILNTLLGYMVIVFAFYHVYTSKKKQLKYTQGVNEEFFKVEIKK